VLSALEIDKTPFGAIESVQGDELPVLEAIYPAFFILIVVFGLHSAGRVQIVCPTVILLELTKYALRFSNPNVLLKLMLSFFDELQKLSQSRELVPRQFAIFVLVLFIAERAFPAVVVAWLAAVEAAPAVVFAEDASAVAALISDSATVAQASIFSISPL
jgi:hypothetical protein